MPIIITLPPELQNLSGGRQSIRIEIERINFRLLDLIDMIEREHAPGIEQRLLDAQRDIRPIARIFIGTQECRVLAKSTFGEADESTGKKAPDPLMLRIHGNEEILILLQSPDDNYQNPNQNRIIK